MSPSERYCQTTQTILCPEHTFWKAPVPLRKDYFDEKGFVPSAFTIEVSLTRFQIFVSINGFSKVKTALTYQGSFTKWKPRNLAG